MRCPPCSMLSFVLGSVATLLACGRPSAPLASADTDAAGGGGIFETGGTSGANSSTRGTPSSGATGAGGAWASGGAVFVGGGSGAGGRPGTGGLGRGGVFGTDGAVDAAAIMPTGGATGGATGGTFAGGTGATATGGTSDTGDPIDAGGAVTVALPPKFFGNIDTRGGIRSDFTTYWDQFTPENAGKWASVQSTISTFNWSSLDALYEYCDERHIPFKEHCFIWGSGQPNWLNNDNAAELARNWMKQFCDRYPKTRIINVVNEPLHTPPSYRQGLGGAGASDWDWLVNSFKWAREACPNAVLVLNDYNIIEYSNEHKRIIDLVQASLADGAPIMAIGAQSHDVAKVWLSTVQTYLADLISQTGLPVYISELDLPIADDVQQAATMKDLITTFWNDPNVPGITYWGYVAGATWRSNAELMTSTGAMRPAMTWLMDFLHR
jgi:endo-1,4-beta-xylanase